MANTWVNELHKLNPKGQFTIWQLSFLLEGDFPPFWWSFVSWKVIQRCYIKWDRTVGSLTHVHSIFPVSAPSCNDMYEDNLRWGCPAHQVEELAEEECRGSLFLQSDPLASHLSPSRGGACLWYRPGSELIASQGFSHSSDSYFTSNLLQRSKVCSKDRMSLQTPLLYTVHTTWVTVLSHLRIREHT